MFHCQAPLLHASIWMIILFFDARWDDYTKTSASIYQFTLFPMPGESIIFSYRHRFIEFLYFPMPSLLDMLGY